jgi:hypothetical protein
MHVPNFKLKNSVKTLLYKLQFVRDFFVLHAMSNISRSFTSPTASGIFSRM